MRFAGRDGVLAGAARTRTRGPRARAQRQRSRRRGPSGPAGTPADPSTGRRRTREQRRNRRSAAFDLLAVVAAVALVGFGLANLYLVGAADLAVRQGVIAAVGGLALAVCWRFRVRYLSLLGWA